MQNSEILKIMKRQCNILPLDHDWMTCRVVGFSNNEKTMEHSDHWIMTGWYGGQWDFQNNKHSDHWIVTG
jgi:hypothetical protein